MSTIASDNVVGTLPKGADVEIQTGSNGKDTIVANKTVTKATFEVTESVGLTGAFKRTKINGSNSSESVTFNNDSKFTKGNVKLGKGNDSITFAKGVQVKGKNTIDLGKGGNDSVVIEDLNNIKGTLVIKKFGKGDSITVNGKVYDYSDRKALNKLDGIKIKGK